MLIQLFYVIIWREMGKGVSGCGIFVTGIRGVPVSEIGGRLPGGYEAFMGADSGRIGGWIWVDGAQ